ncbi:MAG TPA: phosphodiester glycosidase family protein [Gemmatimonadaceae bacterium]|nr:phosphodiester glycosidase family protein [Gemmatimonadaceae bacterium]
MSPIVRRALYGAALAGCAVLGAAHPNAGVHASSAIPRSALAVEQRGVRREWWRSDRAPAHWGAALPAVEEAIVWQPVADGVEWGELPLAGDGEAWRIRVIVARIDPRRVRVRLDTAFATGVLGAEWSIDRAPRDAVLAVNAGQFVGSLPWGWVVLRGREFLAPGRGPLSSAVAIDSSGTMRWVSADSIPAWRRTPHLAAAFQSFPTLLEGDGDVPRALRGEQASEGIDLAHRDARLAIGALRDGRVLIALTRFDALDGTLDFVPFGLTTPEMAALMGALGCARAVMLDGGISSQMLIRERDGVTHRWTGIRRVPLGLVVVPRTDASVPRGETSPHP